MVSTEVTDTVLCTILYNLSHRVARANTNSIAPPELRALIRDTQNKDADTTEANSSDISSQ